jgi:hypothetical protein
MTTLKQARLDVLNKLSNEIDSLPGLTDFHAGDPDYDEAISVIKDQLADFVEDLIVNTEAEDDPELDDVAELDNDEEV